MALSVTPSDAHAYQNSEREDEPCDKQRVFFDGVSNSLKRKLGFWCAHSKYLLNLIVGVAALSRFARHDSCQPVRQWYLGENVPLLALIYVAVMRPTGKTWVVVYTLGNLGVIHSVIHHGFEAKRHLFFQFYPFKAAQTSES